MVEALDQLSEALESVRPLVAGVRADQWSAPTPCAEWSVHDLLNHLVGGNLLYAGVLSGGGPVTVPPAQTVDRLGSDPLGAWTDSAQALLDAFGAPGALEQTITVPFGTVPGFAALHLRIIESLVHGWDLARATGQTGDFPAYLAEQGLAIAQLRLGDIPADRSPFAPSVPITDDAPAIDRLAACLGRDVS